MREGCDESLPEIVEEAIRSFNDGRYYQAHEEFETAWREESREIRVMYQALLQVAVVFLHIGISNYLGATQLGEKALVKFEVWQGICQGIDLDKVRIGFVAILNEVKRLGPEHITDFDQSKFFKIHVVGEQ